MSDTRTIWKFGVDEKVLMPRGSQILCIQTQDGKPRIWALVDPEVTQICRRFEIAGTGTEIEKAVGLFFYVGTWQTATGFVWHLFDLGEEEI